MLQVLRDGEALLDRGRQVRVGVREVGHVGARGAVRDLVKDVEVAGLHIPVGRVDAAVEDELEAAVLRLLRAGVVLVDAQLELLVVLPRGGVLELVRAVADRVLAERLHVVVGRGRQREVRARAEALGEVGDLGAQGDRELGVADDLQTGEVGLHVAAEALDILEEVGRLLTVLQVGGVLPRVHEGGSGDRLAVAELLGRSSA